MLGKGAANRAGRRHQRHRALECLARRGDLTEPFEDVGLLDVQPGREHDVGVLRAGRSVERGEPIEVRGELRPALAIVAGLRLASEHALESAQGRRVLGDERERFLVGETRLLEIPLALVEAGRRRHEVDAHRVGLRVGVLLAHQREDGRPLDLRIEQPAHARRSSGTAREAARAVVLCAREIAVEDRPLGNEPRFEVGARGADRIRGLDARRASLDVRDERRRIVCGGPRGLGLPRRRVRAGDRTLRPGLVVGRNSCRRGRVSARVGLGGDDAGRDAAIGGRCGGRTFAQVTLRRIAVASPTRGGRWHDARLGWPGGRRLGRRDQGWRLGRRLGRRRLGRRCLRKRRLGHRCLGHRCGRRDAHHRLVAGRRQRRGWTRAPSPRRGRRGLHRRHAGAGPSATRERRLRRRRFCCTLALVVAVGHVAVDPTPLTRPADRLL